jgi:type III secretion protein J
MVLRRVVTRAWVAVACGAVLLLGGCSKDELVHGLTEFEANEIVVVLDSAGHKAVKEKELGGRVITYKITVPGASASEARKVLVDNKLPRIKGMGLDKVYDPANKGLIPTATEEMAGYQLALQNEIVAKLKTIPGIIDAHVTVVKPQRDIVRDLSDKAPPATASVVVVYNQVDGKTPFKDSDIQRLVAACVENMDPQNVVVLPMLAKPMDRQVMVPTAGGEGGAEETGTVDKSKAPKLLGVAVADQADHKKLSGILTLAGVGMGVLLLAFVIAIGVAFSARKRVGTMGAEMTALRKAVKRAAEPPP